MYILYPLQFAMSETQGRKGGGDPEGLFPKYSSSFYLGQNHSKVFIPCGIAVK